MEKGDFKSRAADYVKKLKKRYRAVSYTHLTLPTIYGDGLQSRDFTYVDNVVHANLLAADAPNVAGRMFNAANGKATDLLTLLDVLGRLLKTDIKPQFADPRPGDVRESLADITQAREMLDYEPQVDFQEGIRRSIDYYRSIFG